MGLLLFHAWLLNPQQKRPLEFPFMNRCTSHFCIQRVILLKPNYNLLNFWLIDNGARWYKILQKVSFQSQFYFSDAKLLKMSHFRFSILAFSTNFCPIKIDLSGHTFWLASQSWMELFLWFSNTVPISGYILSLPKSVIKAFFSGS